eukprot:sb/3474098/
MALYKVAHGLLVTVSEVWRQDGNSCENKNYGSTLDQFLGNFCRNFLSKIRKFIFHSFVHYSFIHDMSILIVHHYAIFLWLEFIFPMSTDIRVPGHMTIDKMHLHDFGSSSFLRLLMSCSTTTFCLIFLKSWISIALHLLRSP